MFLLFGYLSIAVLQWLQQYRRRKHYADAMLQALKRGSVLIQRGRRAQHGSVGALLNSPLLSSSDSYKETRIYSDNHLAISVVFPRQKVDLGEWTSYLDVSTGNDSTNCVVILLEAEKRKRTNNFVKGTVQPSSLFPIHVLHHGCPIAWKLGRPLGVVLHCTHNNFLLLCDAFGQGRLMLDKDFELHRILSVTPAGKPNIMSLTREHKRETVPTNSIKIAQDTDEPSSMHQPLMDNRSVYQPLVVECSHVLLNGVTDENTKKNQETDKLQLSSTKFPKTDGRESEEGKFPDAEQNNKVFLLKEHFEEGQAVVPTNGHHSEVDVMTSSHICTEGATLITFSAANSDIDSKVFVHRTDTGTDSCFQQNKENLSVHSQGSEDTFLEDNSFQELKDGCLIPAPSDSPTEIEAPHSNCTVTVKDDSAGISNSDSLTYVTNSPAGQNGDEAFQARSKSRDKPPNILVYCGKKDTARKFEIIKSSLEQCINTDAYSIYHLPHEQISTTPWAENAAALVISADNLYDNASQKFSDYLSSGGKIISFGSAMEAVFVDRREVQKHPTITKFGLADWRDVSTMQGRFHYAPGTLKKGNSSMDAVVLDEKTGHPIVVLLTLSSVSGNGCAVFSQLLLDRDPAEVAVDSEMFSQLKQSNTDRLQVLRHLVSLLDVDTSPAPSCQLTPCFLLTKMQSLQTSLLKSVDGRLKKGVIKSRSLSLHFVERISPEIQATADVLPVITGNHTRFIDNSNAGDNSIIRYFDPEVYWHHLTTAELGRVIFYTDVIPTTMTVFEGLQFSIPDNVGVIAIAGRQTSGKGRGGNVWLSPVGCAMFTLPLKVPLDSPLGQRITFLQHMVALSVVHSIRSLPNYQDIDLRLKWPNDIYYKNQMKLGGVLVTSTIMGDKVYATIGCGVNVSNSNPTICINDIIHQHNCETGSSLNLLTPAEVLAMTVSTLEDLLHAFQTKGHPDICKLYYKYWLHGGACVQMEREGNEEVFVCGLDDFGFLEVATKQGKKISVQPDGNSFDMMRNLIAVKRN